ncbi:MAG: hypothetical protein C0408_09655 [Odoribacter sp.]|nr:hypothetical protein [Odoribacter sp.]
MANLNNLYDAIVSGNLELSVETTRSALAEGVEPLIIIQDYLIPAIDKTGEMFENCEAFVPNSRKLTLVL